VTKEVMKCVCVFVQISVELATLVVNDSDYQKRSAPMGQTSHEVLQLRGCLALLNFTTEQLSFRVVEFDGNKSLYFVFVGWFFLSILDCF
jgi:hypothetical protein